jgi:hypothetical protein
VTAPGVVTFTLLSEIEIRAFAAAWAVKVTVQVELPAALKLFGEQETEFKELGRGAARLIAMERVTPFRLAVTVAVWPEVMLPAVTAKVVLAAPLAIFALAGTLRAGLSTLKRTEAPSTDALLKETAQVALCPLFKLPGAQVME